jgi:hypothetical protein
MPIKYDIKPILPNTDGRTDSLPRPAVNLAQRLAQLANEEDVVIARVVIARGEWSLFIEGNNMERLGNG